MKDDYGKNNREKMIIQDAFKIDRTVFSVVSIPGDPDDKKYWLSRTPAERLEAMELIRQINYGYDPATTRLQRILEIIEFTRS